MRRMLLILGLLALCSLLASALVLRGTTGILEGRVRDKQSQEALVGVNVIIVGTPLGSSTDVDGNYRIANIIAGVYDIRFSIIGYKTVVMKRATILPDLRTRIDVEMEASTIELEVVEVRVERPLIQTDLSATAYSVGAIKIEKLPVSSFTEVLTLLPGVTMEGNVRGGKTSEVLFLVDGLPVQDVIGGGVGTSLPKSSISGLTIYTGGYDAEYGNALSGVVNIITRSGGNKQSIGVRFERDNWIPGDANHQTDHLTEIELSAGGPILKDQLSYFTANTFTISDSRWWQDFQHFFDSPISKEFSGFSKIDWQLSPSSKLSSQGIYSLRRWRDYEFSWRFNLAGLPSRSRDAYRGALLFSQTLSQSTFFTASASVFHLLSRIGEGSGGDLRLQPYEYDFYLQYILDGQRNWWADSRQTIYTFKGDLTTNFHRMHLIRVGVEINQYSIRSDLAKYEPQTTYFGKPILDAPLLNYSNSYNYYPRSGSVFIQDKVDVVGEGSNASVGIRWDFLDPTSERPLVEYIPVSKTEYEQHITGTAKASIKHQISPRISFAGQVGPSSFVFANLGQYFQYPLFDYLYSGINPAEIRQGTRSVLAGNPDLEPERTTAWEIGLKHGINENIVGSVTYFKKTFRNQIDSKTLIPFDSKSAGDYGFASYVNNAEATATGVEIVFSRERDEQLSGSISYAYTVTEGISESVDQGINYAQWGFPVWPQPFPLSWDQRHTIKVDADFRLPFDIQTNLIVLYNSPRPYTYYPTRDGFTPLDPSKVLIPNNRRMMDVTFLNLKFSKQFDVNLGSNGTITIYADIRNAFNKKNVRWVDSSGRIGGELGDPSSYYDPRRVRVGLRMDS